MLIKINLLFPSFVRQRAEKKVIKAKAYTHKQWVMIDRIVITSLFIAAIILGILIS